MFRAVSALLRSLLRGAKICVSFRLSAHVNHSADKTIVDIVRSKYDSAACVLSVYDTALPAIASLREQYQEKQSQDMVIIDTTSFHDVLLYLGKIPSLYCSLQTINPPAMIVLYSLPLETILSSFDPYSRNIDLYREKPVNPAEFQLSLELLLGRRRSAIQSKNNIRLLIEKLNQLRCAADQTTAENHDNKAFMNTFLSLISHEIRTPVNSITNFANFLEEELSAHNTLSVKDILTITDSITCGSIRLARTIDTIVNYAQIVSGEYEPSYARFKLSSVLESVSCEFRKRAERKGLQFRYMQNIDPLVNGDAYAVGKIFEHLLDNAVKYSQQGTISVSLTESATTYRIMFTDTGIGMSPDMVKHVLKPFAQESEGYTRNYDGLGLGLSLAYRFAELNNIEMYITSEKSAGTTITLLYPKIDTFSVQNTISTQMPIAQAKM